MILTTLSRKISFIKIDFHTHSIYLHLLQHYESHKPPTKFYANCRDSQEFEIMWKHAVFEFVEHLELLLWLLMIAKNKIGFMVSVWKVSMGVVSYLNCGSLFFVGKYLEFERFEKQSISVRHLRYSGISYKVYSDLFSLKKWIKNQSDLVSKT